MIYKNHVTPTGIRLVKESASGTYIVWQVACLVGPDYEDLQDTILSQDRPVVESERPWLLPPLSSRMMLYIRPADLPLVAFQKWLEELHVPQEVYTVYPNVFLMTE